MTAFLQPPEYTLDELAFLAPFLAIFYRRLSVLALGYHRDVIVRFQKPPKSVTVISAIPLARGSRGLPPQARAQPSRRFGSPAEKPARKMPAARHRDRRAIIVALSMIAPSNPSPASCCGARGLCSTATARSRGCACRRSYAIRRTRSAGPANSQHMQHPAEGLVVRRLWRATFPCAVGLYDGRCKPVHRLSDRAVCSSPCPLLVVSYHFTGIECFGSIFANSVSNFKFERNMSTPYLPRTLAIQGGRFLGWSRRSWAGRWGRWT